MSVILGVWGGIGVDFVACELWGTTMYIRTTMNKLLNVNLPRTMRTSKAVIYFSTLNREKVLYFVIEVKHILLC